MDGYKFDSKVERDEYFRLKLMQEAGEINTLRIHPSYVLFAGDGSGTVTKVGEFTPDFFFYDIIKKINVIDEIKNPNDRKDAAYRLRLKIFRANYPKVKIVEVVYGARGQRTERVC
jgi:hypothetical protein